MLKIKQEHYDAMRGGCLSVLESHPGIAEKYRDAGLSAMRLNWDILRASTIDGKGGITWICDNLYGYLNDTHINSALARIMGNDGTNADGKKR